MSAHKLLPSWVVVWAASQLGSDSGYFLAGLWQQLLFSLVVAISASQLGSGNGYFLAVQRCRLFPNQVVAQAASQLGCCEPIVFKRLAAFSVYLVVIGASVKSSSRLSFQTLLSFIRATIFSYFLFISCFSSLQLQTFSTTCSAFMIFQLRLPYCSLLFLKQKQIPSIPSH